MIYTDGKPTIVSRGVSRTRARGGMVLGRMGRTSLYRPGRGTGVRKAREAKGDTPLDPRCTR